MRSAYKEAVKIFFSHANIASSSFAPSSSLWKVVWSPNVPPKVRRSKVRMNALATKENLWIRNCGAVSAIPVVLRKKKLSICCCLAEGAGYYLYLPSWYFFDSEMGGLCCG